MAVPSATKWKIAAIISCGALLIVLAGAFLLLLSGRDFAWRLNPTAVVTQVKQLNELVTVKYSIQRVIGMHEQKLPFGEESILLMVQGEVLAGVDLGRLNASDVELTGERRATITLPAARLLHSFLDEKQTRVWDRQITWWTPWVPYDPDLEHKARLQAIDDVRKAALDMGILDEAQRNAQTTVKQVLAAFRIETRFKMRPLD